MTTETVRRQPRRDRRRVLGLLGGLGTIGLLLPRSPSLAQALASSRPAKQLPSMHEADFYRPHDLAG